MADLWADNVAPSLHRINFGYRSDPTTKFATAEDPGRPDGMFVYGGFGGYIEIKSSPDMSYDMTSWRENQINWYKEWCLPFDIPMYIWLNMGGTANPNVQLDTDKNKYPRKAWLIPIEMYQLVMGYTQVNYGSNSIPYHAKKNYDREMQTDSWDAMTLFKSFELKWLGSKTWKVEPKRLLSQCYDKTAITIKKIQVT